MEEAQNDPKRRKGGAIMLLLFLLILFSLGEVVTVFSFHQKIASLENDLAKAQEKRNKLKIWKQKAVLSVDTVSALRAWKGVDPRASFFLDRLQSIEEGLTLEFFSISRYFALKSLPPEEQLSILPHPIQPLFLFDDLEFSICETHSGSGVLSFPRFRSRLNKNINPPLSYERISSVSPYAYVEEIPAPNAWLFSLEYPPLPLWENVLEADQ